MEEGQHSWKETVKRFVTKAPEYERLKVLHRFVLDKLGNDYNVQEAQIQMSEVVDKSEHGSTRPASIQLPPEFEIQLKVGRLSRTLNEKDFLLGETTCDTDKRLNRTASEIEEVSSAKSLPEKETNERNIIKVKIIVPRESESYIETNVVSVMNEVPKNSVNLGETCPKQQQICMGNPKEIIYEEIYEIAKKQPNAYKTNTLEKRRNVYSPAKPSRCIFTQPKQEREQKVVCDLEEERIQSLINKSGNYPPLMGKNALLAKVCKPQNKHRNDAEIVHKLVTENFNQFYDHYYQRSYRRATLRQKTCHQPEKNNYDILRDENETNHNLNFLRSTDDLNLETTNESTVTTDLDEEPSATEKKPDYDPEIFLRDALGDEMENSTASELEENYQNQQNLSKSLRSNRSTIGTSDISCLISKNSIYSTLTKKFRRLCSTPLRNPIQEEESERKQCLANAERIDFLMHEAAKQFQAMLQTSKALNYCRLMKEFASGREQIEAEKILLVATCKRKALLNEIHKLENEDDLYQLGNNLGTVTITNVTFKQKEEELRLPASLSVDHYFLILVQAGSKVLNSTMTVLNNGVLRFDQEFKLTDLPAHFEIKLSLYSLQLRDSPKNCTLNQNNKHSRTKISPMKRIFSPKRLLKPALIEDTGLEKSSFDLWGECSIKIAHLLKRGPFKLVQVPLCSTLQSDVELDIRSEVNLDVRCSGFLNIGFKSGGCATWTRRWCSLFGSQLNYWNYPHEELERNPIGCFELSCCVTSYVTLADREICPRPRTLLLEIAENNENTHTIERYFLATDTTEELKVWENKINAVVIALRNWKCMKFN